MNNELRTWRVTGTKAGKLVTVNIQAADHNEAVRKASKSRGLLLVVRSCRLLTGAELPA